MAILFLGLCKGIPPLNWTSPWMIKLRGLTRAIGVNRAVTAVFQRPRYEDRFGDALVAHVRAGDVVWDIGANVGIYTAAFLGVVGQQGKVIAFEPTLESYKELQDRFGGKPAFASLNVAIGEADGVAALRISDEDCSPTNQVVLGGEASADTRIVVVRSVDSVCRECPEWVPNVVKVDVEGHEGAVFKGFGPLMSDRRLRAVGVEIHFGVLQGRGESGTPDAIRRTLEDSGFTVGWTDPSHIVATR